MSTPDIEAIALLAREYYDGMLYGNAGSLARTFDAGARFQGVRDGEQVRRGLPEFIAMVSGAGADAPRPGEAEYSMSVALIDITGPVAIVKVRDRFRGRTYVDYLTVMKVGDEWR
ncbi:MAG TPA: nuclear transport factor 2 family protein, partial [Steroidobacteraceae bacterium]|nr:nuclear transport factor 2 family protein [Steroidobacteraceae bacterium]